MGTNLNFVNGEWTEAETGDTFENTNPADPADVIGSYQSSSAADAERAIEAAAEAADEWAATPGPKRGALLRRTAAALDDRREEATATLVREEGKTRPEAAGEVGRAVDIFYYYAEKAREIGGDVKAASGGSTDLYTVNEPVGVVSLITPWNYPIAIPAWKLAPALAAGNTAVLKPASIAPECARILVECLDEAGAPDGVVNYVTGSGSKIGGPLSTHEAIDAVSFTGSAEVGHHVYEEATVEGKRVQTEMGGKNPTVVTENADVDRAVNIVGSGAFGVTGQACTATSRAIVHEDVVDDFVEGIVDYGESLEIGPGDSGADMGPHVSESELESTLKYIELAQDEGATLVSGGEKVDRDGYFVEPTVFTDVDNGMRIAQEEVFGPVLAVITVSDYEEAVETANDVQFGLSSAIVTEDLNEAKQFTRDAEAGIVKVNQKTTGVELHVPFGGFKNSSSETWREQGDAGLDFYTISKTVYETF
ncbi:MULTISPECIES: aldehyde dehydrogenase family protein [unclassified Haladaptatus]|uniref:2,5-dioxovalerate dehydrogenase n=1 Tax=unclassified Haladaptatus TaxID=2622732 RepID=UPI0023E89287|nr:MULTISPECIES: aldehyde dehydrogenase family protein [unclassified Haladaptatus]